LSSVGAWFPARSFPIHYGFQLTPPQLPNIYTPQGINLFASGNSKDVPANTIMDVNGFEKDMAALTPGGVASALDLSGTNHPIGSGQAAGWLPHSAASIAIITGARVAPHRQRWRAAPPPNSS
jgi:hypothetical protein